MVPVSFVNIAMILFYKIKNKIFSVVIYQKQKREAKKEQPRDGDCRIVFKILLAECEDILEEEYLKELLYRHNAGWVQPH